PRRGGGARRQAAPPRPHVGGPPGRRGGRRRDEHEDARRLERQGQARARLEAQLSQLAPGLRGGAAMNRSTGPDDQLLEELRPRAFAIAYRMLGSVSEAEDVVQEGLLRLHTTLEKEREGDGGGTIASPEAFLTTIVSRLAIDELRSAR